MPFEDTLDTLGRWTTRGPVTLDAGSVVLGSGSTPGALRLKNPTRFFGIEVEHELDDETQQGLLIEVKSTTSTSLVRYWIEPVVNGTPNHSVRSYFEPGYPLPDGEFYGEGYNVGFPWMMIRPEAGGEYNNTVVKLAVTEEQPTVPALSYGSFELPDGWNLDSVDVTIVGTYGVRVSSVAMRDRYGGFTGDAPNVVDPFDPNAGMPENPTKPEPECATLLELIRQFSATVKRAVRIVGPTTIEMVDPNEPLPTGWTVDDGACFYHSQNQTLTAGSTVLSLMAGRLVLDIDASFINDDVRLPVSDWRIPQRLPLYGGLDPAPVKRVAYSFTPRGFAGSVEFHVKDVPLNLRRIG